MNEKTTAQLTAQIVAQDQLDNLQSYLERGRAHQALTLDELQTAYIDAVRLWAAEVMSPDAIREASDLMSELRLRNADPPDHLLAKEIELITSVIQSQVETTSSMEEVGNVIVDAYQARRPTRQ